METRSIVLGFLIAGLIGGCMAEAEQEQATKKQQDKQEKKKNRLAKEKSPYLLQHAENPVDWYPWGKEAFEKAKKENKPIFLSIGYSTCHWCHVMEHESFENEEIAKYLNEHFVSIKVDREERPDVDEIYMTALTQVLGQHGGWPMSMFLTPDRKPFFGGTYFPPEDKFGRPGFPKILKSIHEYWDEKGEEALKSADAIAERLKEISGRTAQGELNVSLVADALSHYEKVFDDTHGGFGRAPFFPQPSYGLFLLRHHGRTGSERSLAIVENQLEHMGEGGIYDHLGGGFARYSTDARWLVPHFEKMLYDNGQLLKLYAETYLATGSKNALYRRILRETSEYILRDMTDPKGGFYSAEDADSEGEEGKFYVWRHEEVAALLDKKSARVFGLAYDVSEEGNWEGDAHHGVKPLNVLNAKLTATQVASLEKMDVAEVEKILAAARKTLFEAREKRIRPLRDDKILTAWNGLMISGFSAAGRALQEPRYIAAAEKAAEFIRATLYKDGTLKRRYRDGEAAIDATLNDYAFFVSGLLDLYEATFEAKWLLLASELNDRCVELFYDEDDGGFFFSLAGRADLIVRSKDFSDGAVPAGNSVATLNLVRLSEIRSNDALRTRAERSLGAQAELMKSHPSICPYLMIALDHLMGPAREIVIAGDPKAPETREMIEFVQTRFLPRTVVVLADGSLDVKLIPMLEGKTIVDGKPAVYVCENYTCKAPTTSLLELRRLLK